MATEETAGEREAVVASISVSRCEFRSATVRIGGAEKTLLIGEELEAWQLKAVTLLAAIASCNCTSSSLMRFHCRE